MLRGVALGAGENVMLEITVEQSEDAAMNNDLGISTTL